MSTQRAMANLITEEATAPMLPNVVITKLKADPIAERRKAKVSQSHGICTNGQSLHPLCMHRVRTGDESP